MSSNEPDSFPLPPGFIRSRSGVYVVVTVYVFGVPFPAVTTMGIGFVPASTAIGPNTDPEAANKPLIVNVAVEFATVI